MSQSRIGKRPINLPAGVKVEINGQTVSVTGPKGNLSRTLRPEVSVTLDNGTLLVQPVGNEKIHRALHGLSRTLVANMVDGVTTGFKKTLEINGVGAIRLLNRPPELKQTVHGIGSVHVEDPTRPIVFPKDGSRAKAL